MHALHAHAITSTKPMRIRVCNLKGNTSKLNWAADILTGPVLSKQFTHRLISTRTEENQHRIIIRDERNRIVAEHISPQPVAVDDIISWANTQI